MLTVVALGAVDLDAGGFAVHACGVQEWVDEHSEEL